MDDDDEKMGIRGESARNRRTFTTSSRRIYDEGMSGQASAQGGQEADEDNEQWQKWRGRWWMRIDRAELSSRQRRKISRVVRRLVSRETNDIDYLVSELKQSIAEMRESAEIQKATQYYHMSSGEDGHTRPHGRDMMGREDGHHSW